MRSISFLITFIVVVTLFSCNNDISSVKVSGQYCNYEVSPEGVYPSQPCLSWDLVSSHKGSEQKEYRLLISDNPKQLAEGDGNIYDSHWVNDRAKQAVLPQSVLLKSGKRYYWKVKIRDEKGALSEWSQTDSFVTSLRDTKEWGDAIWVSNEELPEDKVLKQAIPNYKDFEVMVNRLPIFRKELSLKKEIKSAVAFVCGLGSFHMHVNGKQVGDNFLQPAWTNYEKSCEYMTFDITKMLKRGENVLAMELGNAFFYVPSSRMPKLVLAAGTPRFIAKINIEYVDGTTAQVVSDLSWKSSRGPVIFSSIYGGEDYDARLEQIGWKETGFDDKGWKTVKRVIAPGGKLVEQMIPQVKIIKELSTIDITRHQNGLYIYDLGQNCSGVPSIKVKAPKGTAIELIAGESMYKEGDHGIEKAPKLELPSGKRVQLGLGTPRQSGGQSIFRYIAKGEGVEEWHPRFTYYGYRYIMVVGAAPRGKAKSGEAEILEMKTLHTMAAIRETGHFKCDDPILNDIHALIDGSIRSNSSFVLTDCPHREKLGWLEQSHLMANSLFYRYDYRNFYKKIFKDMIEAQHEDGAIPCISPHFVNFGMRPPVWQSAFILDPWYIYQWYGDNSLFAPYYKQMANFMSYVRGRRQPDGTYRGGYGDWSDADPDRKLGAWLTKNEITSNSVYYQDIQVMSKVAKMLGKTADSAYFSNWGDSLKSAFNKVHLDKKALTYTLGRQEKASQTAYAMPLNVGLVPDIYKEKVFDQLCQLIKEDGRLTSGETGWSYLVKELTKRGEAQLLYDMATNPDHPGYVYMLKKGATALTESWHAAPNLSNNHCMLGHYMSWLYAGLAGIKQQEGSLAFRKIVIQPQPVKSVKNVECTYDSPQGAITSNWKINGETMTMDVSIPVGATARVMTPTTTADKVMVNGMTYTGDALVQFTGMEGNYAVFEVPSGQYTLTFPFNQLPGNLR